MSQMEGLILHPETCKFFSDDSSGILDARFVVQVAFKETPGISSLGPATQDE